MRVTLLLAVHNGARYLREALDSIFSQTFTDFEALVVDDASTDDTASILASYRDERLRVVRNETNLGLTKSLNIGLSLARGEYIARHDADDRSHRERLARQVAFLDANPHVALLGTRVRLIDERGRARHAIGSHVAQSRLGVELQLLFGNPFVHSSVMFRRDVILAAGGYDETILYSQDFELWSRLLAQHDCRNTGDTLLDYRAHVQSATRSRDQTVVERFRVDYQTNLDVQRRNIMRILGSQQLASTWPQLWTSNAVPWLAEPGDNSDELLHAMRELVTLFEERHRGALKHDDVRRQLAQAYLVAARRIAPTNVRAALRAWRRAFPLAPALALRYAPRALAPAIRRAAR